MIKQIASIEVKVGERSYTFICGNNSPAGEVYDALTQMRSEIFEMILAEEERSRKPEEKSEKPCDNCKNPHCDCESDPDFK